VLGNVGAGERLKLFLTVGRELGRAAVKIG
jgi:hypothetical protein